MKLSIIMPTYNDGLYITQAINAILNQPYQNIELIIVNDGSTDDTKNIVFTPDPRVRYFENPRNLGITKTVNFGIRQATGEYIYWASSDDWIADNFFKDGMKALAANPDAAFCFFDLIFVKNDKNYIVRTLPQFTETTKIQPQTMWNLYRKNYFHIPASGAIVKKVELEKRGLLPEEIDFLNDLVVYTHIALETMSIYIPKVAAYFALSRDETGRKRTRKYQLNQRSGVLCYLKKDKPLFKKLCYSTLLPKSFHYSLYTLFLRPKHWDMMIPMVWVKFMLMFSKLWKNLTGQNQDASMLLWEITKH